MSRVLIQTSASFFFLFHVLATVAFSLPSTEFTKTLRGPFEVYVWALQFRQSYTMFVHRHEWVDMNVTLVAQNTAGETKSFGAVLPDFHPFTANDSRISKIMSHIIGSRDRSRQRQLQRYLSNACDQIALENFAPISIAMHITGEKIVSLKEMRLGGEQGRHINFVRGPIACSALE